MRQFFTINPELIQSARNLGTNSSLKPIMQGHQTGLSPARIFMLSPTGKIIKKDSVTTKLTKCKYN